MTDIVEVHWNAKPHLQRLGIKIGSGDLNPRAEKLFEQIREGATRTFPDSIAIVRIATRSKDPLADLRVTRSGREVPPADIEAVRTMIVEAVDGAEEQIAA